MSLYAKVVRPVLFHVEPERAHGMTITALKAGMYPRAPQPHTCLTRSLLGLRFSSPVGLAAGFDKNAEVPDAALRLGFGFAEVGTLTPRPQAGNPRPRLFRLPADRAVINRMGFNNDGFEPAFARLQRRPRAGIVGVNVGANRDSANRIDDYAAGVTRFSPVADYITINISSPNTPGLRDLQGGDQLGELLSAVTAARDAARPRVPLLVKIAPDLERGAVLEQLVETVMTHGIDGMIVANTTLDRAGLSDPLASEQGGLSGRPLFTRSTALLAEIRSLTAGDLVLVGVGGIDSAEAAWHKMTAGADLVQLYSGMIYEGPLLAARITQGLAQRLVREGVTNVEDIVGADAEKWRGAG